MTKLTVNQCLQSQLHLGHLKNEWNPKTSPYILGERNKHHIFDLNQTIFSLNRVLKVVKQISSQGGQVLFLGRPPVQIGQVMKKSNPYDRITEAAATACGQPYSIDKWTYGTFTNWNQMIKQLIQKNKKDYLRSEKLDVRQMKLYKRSLRKKSQENYYRPGSVDWPYLKDTFISELNFEVHKRENEATLSKVMENTKQACPLLNANFEESTDNLLSSTQLLTQRRFSVPSIIFAIGVKSLEQPLKEAQQIGIPVIAVVDSDCDPAPNGQPFDYIIPGNDDSIRAYALYSNLISKAIQEGREDFTQSIYNDWLVKKSN